MRYRIVVFPSTPVQDEANALRKRYDRHYTSIDPHINLKASFTLNETTRDTIIQDLHKIAKESIPFSIHITKVSSFAPVTNTIYFKVEPSTEITTLYDAIHDGIFSNEPKPSFVPHITVAQELNDDEYSDVYVTLRMKDLKLHDTIDCFHLCRQSEDGSWQIEETFNLGETS